MVVDDVVVVTVIGTVVWRRWFDRRKAESAVALPPTAAGGIIVGGSEARLGRRACLQLGESVPARRWSASCTSADDDDAGIMASLA